jgi:hypothetical protein
MTINGNTSKIYVGHETKFTYTNPGDVSNHIVGQLNRTTIDAVGRTLLLAIGGEDKFEVIAGTVTDAIMREVQCIPYGAVTTLYGVRPNLPIIGAAANVGTFIGFAYPDHASIANIGRVSVRYCLYNYDAQAPIINLATTYLDGPLRLKTYTRATLPAAAAYSGFPSRKSRRIIFEIP